MADQSLIEYIKKCKGLGRTDAQVRLDLLKVGWDASDVDSAFFEISPSSRPPTAMQAIKPSAASAAQRLGEEAQAASPQAQAQAAPIFSPLSLLPTSTSSQTEQPSMKTSPQTSPASQPAPTQSLAQQPSMQQAAMQTPQAAQPPTQQTTTPAQPLQQPAQQAQALLQQIKPQPAFGAAPKQPPIKLIAAALFIVLILIGAYMYVNATKPAQPIVPPAANASAQGTVQNASAQQPSQPQAQNRTQAPSQPSTQPPPPPPPLPAANAAANSATSPPPSSLPSSSLEQAPQGASAQQNASANSQANASSQPANNTSSQQQNVLSPTELGLPPGVLQPAPTIPQQNTSSQNRTNRTSTSAQNASAKNTTNQTTAPAQQIKYPVRLWRTVGDSANPRHFCYSLDKNYLRAYYYEYKGDYCNGDYEMKGFNWTFELIDSCTNMPCCRYNSTTKISRNYIYFQCDSD